MMATQESAVRQLVAAELSETVDLRVSDMAAAIAAAYPCASRAVLFYGSCLRERQLEGLMLDFYLIVSDYGAAYDRAWLARANRLIPPNVFPFTHEGLSAKYAVLSEADFARLCGQGADNVSVWARFAQPSRLVWAADDIAQMRVIDTVAQAVPTLLALAAPCVGQAEQGDWRAVFGAGFAHTYRAELRAERQGRSVGILDADPDRYRAMFEAAQADGALARLRDEQGAEARWRQLQRHGKWLSVIRLIKASFTFAGGIDYLAWKINRHAGTSIVITPWQRRHPLMAAIILLPRLLAKKAVG
jgi:hypothetical protein